MLGRLVWCFVPAILAIVIVVVPVIVVGLVPVCSMVFLGTPVRRWPVPKLPLVFILRLLPPLAVSSLIVLARH